MNRYSPRDGTVAAVPQNDRHRATERAIHLIATRRRWDVISHFPAQLHHLNFIYQQPGRNQRGTAKLLGISRATLVRRLQRMDSK
jgi:DNA-binding MarR family transcriptional regulator